MDAGCEMDAAVAERVMGWVDFWYNGDGMWVMGYPPEEQTAGIDSERHPVPHYSTDIAAAFEMEAEIERRGLVIPFVTALILAVLGSDALRRHDMRGLYDDQIFALVHATPEQRCRAALAAIGVEDEVQITSSQEVQ